MTAVAATATPNPDHCHPLSVGQRRLNIPPAPLLGGRDALKTRAANVPGTPGPSLATETSRRSRIRSAANLLCFVSSAARSASTGGRRSAIQTGTHSQVFVLLRTNEPGPQFAIAQEAHWFAQYDLRCATDFGRWWIPPRPGRFLFGGGRFVNRNQPDAPGADLSPIGQVL